jgi:hypothetical protein
VRALVAFYERAAARWGRYRWIFFMAAIAVASTSWLATTSPAAVAAMGTALPALAALALLAMVWTWGLFLVGVWFAPETRAPAARLARSTVAMFLTLWFAAGTLGVLWALARELR